MRKVIRYSLLVFLSVCLPAWPQPYAPGENPAMAMARPPEDSSKVIADRIVTSKIPVLVDFWAPWCSPCRMLGPTIEELKKEYAGKISVMKINVDIHRGLAAYFKISAIPAVFIIANRTVVEYFPGVQSKETYKQAVEKALKSAAAPPVKQPPKNNVKPPSNEEGQSSSSGEAE